jgi:hypothetical protein
MQGAKAFCEALGECATFGLMQEIQKSYRVWTGTVTMSASTLFQNPAKSLHSAVILQWATQSKHIPTSRRGIVDSKHCLLF